MIFSFFWIIFTLSQNFYASAAHGAHDKYEVCSALQWGCHNLHSWNEKRKWTFWGEISRAKLRAKQSGRGKESFLAKDCHQKGESNPTMVASCENATWQGGDGEQGLLLPRTSKTHLYLLGRGAILLPTYTLLCSWQLAGDKHCLRFVHTCKGNEERYWRNQEIKSQT